MPVQLFLKKQSRFYCIFLCCMFWLNNPVKSQLQKDTITVIIIRHGEKPSKGDNLNCQGLNRAELLPDVIISKFGVPAYAYVPSLSADSATKHARMFQTITPLAVKYNLAINSKYNNRDSSGLVQDILKKQGTVMVVWNHNNIVAIVHAFGIKDTQLKWSDDDFDSIWVIRLQNGNAVLTKDKEALKPAAYCR